MPVGRIDAGLEGSPGAVALPVRNRTSRSARFGCHARLFLESARGTLVTRGFSCPPEASSLPEFDDRLDPLRPPVFVVPKRVLRTDPLGNQLGERCWAAL